MRLNPMRLAGAALLSAIVAPAAGQNPLAAPILAHPRVHGAAGPFTRATVTLRRTEPVWGTHFDGVLEAGGARLKLDGPDEPPKFFFIDPKAVVFTPLDRTGANGVVILYISAQIEPRHGVDN